MPKGMSWALGKETNLKKEDQWPKSLPDLGQEVESWASKTSTSCFGGRCLLCFIAVLRRTSEAPAEPQAQ